MKPRHIHATLLALPIAVPFATAAENEGYLGYLLNQKGDPESATYKTANTNTAPSFVLPEDPDVYLNATVDVESIRVDVADLTAKVNVDAKVLNLLHFSAGVDASIDRVNLQIDDVYARAELEARLGNVVRMVNDALGSIDLNPLVASLGQNTQKIVGSATDVVEDTTEGLLAGEAKPPGQHNGPPPSGGGASQDKPLRATEPEKAPPQGAQQKPSPQGAGAGQQAPRPTGTRRKNPSDVKPHGSTRAPHPVEAKDPNILWFIPNRDTGGATYNTLTATGDVLRVECDAQGNTLSWKVAGPYSDYMAPTDVSKTVRNARGEWERAFEYGHTLHGLTRVCWLYKNQWGRVVRTEVEPFDWSQVRDGT